MVVNIDNSVLYLSEIVSSSEFTPFLIILVGNIVILFKDLHSGIIKCLFKYF